MTENNRINETISYAEWLRARAAEWTERVGDDSRFGPSYQRDAAIATQLAALVEACEQWAAVDTNYATPTRLVRQIAAGFSLQPPVADRNG